MSMFEPKVASSFFPLPSLGPSDDLPPLRYSLPELRRVEPHFALPSLDEYAAGCDRMLVGLEDGGWWGLGGGREDVKGKGKERAVPEVEGVSDADVPKLEDGTRAVEEPTMAGTGWDRMAERMDMEVEAGPSRPRAFKPIRTWDDPSEGVAESPFAAESGRAVFEAINAISDPPLSLPHLRSRPPSAPVNPDDLLRLMIRATLGTTTTDDLQWDRKRSAYILGARMQRAEGFSRAATAAAVKDFLDIATALRRLDQLINQQIKSPLTPTHHALFHAVSTYLTFIKNRLSSAIADSENEENSGWIKWKATLRDVGDLLRMLLEIMGWPLSEPKALPLSSRPSSLLTHLYSQLLAQHQTSSPCSPTTPTVLCLAYLLQSSSAPFLKLLHAWVGLSDSTAEASTDAEDQPWADLGITRTPRQSRGNPAADVGWEYEFSSKRMPTFIPKECRRKLFEAGRSLRLLGEANADHPLAGGGWGLEGSWGWGKPFEDVQADVRAHTKRIARETEHWRRSVRERSRPLSGGSSLMRTRQRKERKRLPLDFFDPAASAAAHAHAVDGLSDDAEESTDTAEKQLADFLTMLNLTPGSKPHTDQSTALWSSSPLDALNSFLAYHSAHPILPPSYHTFPLFISHHLLAPLLAHADLVSAALVSLYLDDLHLTDHLDILQSFFLGGDVGFFERVSAALFGKEDQKVGQGANMGRRARTRARMGLSSEAGARGDASGEEPAEWGIALGVGLSDRQRWPPGGAELAYALRTTLLDDSTGHTGQVRGGVAWSEVEDRVSFAIKPLPEDEDGVRSKWMDPQAIEALDFLYLSYSPPSAMSVVLPRAILAKYQTINNFLLRLCRVNAVIRSMFQDLHKPSAGDEVNESKSGVDVPRPRSRARPSPRSHRAPVFSSEPGLEKTVLHLRFRMGHFVSALMRYVVDSAIGVNFDRMRQRLEKLKRRTSASSAVPGDEDAYSDFGYGDSPGVEDLGGIGEGFGGSDDLEDGGDEPIHQLRSVHSLVAYHHITLDRIMRACLLSPAAGHDVAFKLLMRLCGLILDLGKVVKEAERRMVDVPRAGERVREIKKEWEEKERVFMLALERLSQKSSKKDKPATDEIEDEGRDLEVLMGGEELDGTAGQASGLGELLLRLKLNIGEGDRRGGREAESI